MVDHQTEIRRRVSLPAYLKELAVFAGRAVNEHELTTLEFMEAYRRQTEALSKMPAVNFLLPFEGRKSPKFASFVNQLRDLNPEPVYLWTSRTNDCGLFKLDDVSKLNFAFPFEINPAGILVVTTIDGNDRMLLDFSEENQGQKLLELELRGRNWVKATM